MQVSIFCKREKYNLGLSGKRGHSYEYELPHVHISVCELIQEK